MVLFKKDWEQYPTAIVDTQTTNEHFVRYALLLKSMGVENFAFPLILVNPELQGVDPRDPDLTMEQVAMIVEECSCNPWYIFREVIKLPPSGGSVPLDLQANRGNISLYWLFFNHVTTLLIQPRQTGKSVSTDCLMVALIYILTVSTDVHLLTKDDTLRTRNVKRVKDIVATLPHYLRLKNKQDTNNTEKITVNRLGNTYLTAVPQASVKAAKNLGRGLTVAIHHIDEIAFINNIKHSLPVLLASAGAARDNAALEDAPYGNIFTTTAGYLNTDSGLFAKTKIYDKCLGWTEKLYDCVDEQDLHNTIKSNSPSGELQVLLEFNHRQLGKTDAWLREKIAMAVADGEDAGADFLNIWADGGTEAALTKDELKRITNSKIGDPYNDISEFGYIVRWFVPKQEVITGMVKKRQLVMGLDTSEASGNDDIGMVIRDVYTGEVIGAGTYNETNTITFAKWIAYMLEEFPNMTLVIERKSTGVSILDNLMLILPSKDIDPLKRIFNWIANDSLVNDSYREIMETPLDRRPHNIYDKHKKLFGFTTAGAGRQAREALYGKNFQSAINYTSTSVRDGKLAHQISRLVRKDGKIDHRPKEHDDMVIAWMLSYWFLLEARNKHYYGIKHNQVLVTVTDAIIEEQGGVEAVIEKERVTAVKNRINDLIDAIESGNLPNFRVKIIRNQIRVLNESLEDTDKFDLNIDALLDKTIKPIISKQNKNTYGLRPFRLAA